MTYNPDQARNNHGEFGTADVALKGVQPKAPIPAASVSAAQAQAAKVAGKYKPMNGLPQSPIQLGAKVYVPGPIERLKDAADDYMKKAGLEYNPPQDYAKLDTERAQRIADEFEKEVHNPDDPQVKASYEALAKETMAQWDTLKQTGLKVEWVKPGQTDPYATSPRMAAVDVSENNHWWGFPTDQGFGSGPDTEKFKVGNPLLKPTGEMIDGRPVLVNDVFRIVHDMFGHLKEGNGFRAEGEENAWRSHAAMFSDLARPAMTNETRGQNSWVNYGPFGARNRTASGADTHFAPQKIGKLPDWAVNEGRT